MQQNKASKATTNSLRDWLQKPSTSSGGSTTPKDELEWVDKSKDLSSVSLKPSNSGGGVGVFMGGLCGKRK